MNTRFRMAFVLGCALVLALHAPRCLDALRGQTPGEAIPSAMAALDEAPATAMAPRVAQGATRP